jgi:hypothetical protein
MVKNTYPLQKYIMRNNPFLIFTAPIIAMLFLLCGFGTFIVFIVLLIAKIIAFIVNLLPRKSTR